MTEVEREELEELKRTVEALREEREWLLGELARFANWCAKEHGSKNAEELERENEELHLENEELRDSIHFHLTKGNG